MKHLVAVFLAILCGCSPREIAAPVEEPTTQVVPGWCGMLLFPRSEYETYAPVDPSATCPDGSQPTATSIWWPRPKNKACAEWTHLGPYARNTWGCKKMQEPVDTIPLGDPI